MKWLRAWKRRLGQALRARAGVRVASLLQGLRGSWPRRAGPERYSPDWYAMIYAALGAGFAQGRSQGGGSPGEAPHAMPAAAEDRAAAPARGCRRCPRDQILGLLPGEEAMFGAAINDTDFRLGDNPVAPGRRIITCAKLGKCGGHMPYVCRVAPALFSGGFLYVDETRCETSAADFLAENGAALERLRGIARAHGLHREKLGYRRVVPDAVPDRAVSAGARRGRALSR